MTRFLKYLNTPEGLARLAESTREWLSTPLRTDRKMLVSPRLYTPEGRAQLAESVQKWTKTEIL